MLAAAGVRRLGIKLPHVLDLRTDRFVPAPGQGALAVQTRERGAAKALIAVLEDASARCTVTAERSFLRTINAGCHVPVGALATMDDNIVSLRAQLFSEDGNRMVEGIETGDDAGAVGVRLAERLWRELSETS